MKNILIADKLSNEAEKIFAANNINCDIKTGLNERRSIGIPINSEPEVIKHFTKLSQKNNTIDDLDHLGFNGGQGGVTITEDLIKDLEEAINNGYYNYFASDGFFWGQQFQEERVNEYKAQDKQFLKWAKEQVKAGRQIGYDCSW